MTIRSRQDELIRMLRRCGTTTIAQLTDALQISRRTALRDIAELREQGFVIRATSGPGGGLYLDPSSIQVSPRLSSAEVFALLISISVLKETHAIPFAHLADAGLKKIEQSLPRDRVLELRDILQSVYIGRPTTQEMPPSRDEIDSSVLPAFETGFLQSQRLRFGYTDRHGAKTQRVADPHAILVLSPFWYLIGYDPNRDGFRHFRMDRIAGATVLDEPFRRQPFTVDEGECPFSYFCVATETNTSSVAG